MAAWLAALALAGCPATTVHYGPTSIGTPWVASRSITGNLFVYGGRALMDERINSSDGLVLYVRGGTGNPATKILWRTKRGSGELVLKGRRLDAAGSFTQRFVSAGRDQFPSIVRIPVAGCWRLSLRTGRSVASFVVKAVDPPSEPVCQPSAVLRHTPHPRFGTVTWMPTTPRSNGIAAVLFVSTLPGADRALIYAGGRAPEGWATKFLWWSPKPGAGLTLVAWRLDGSGSFKQSFPSAWSDDPPVTGQIFPSIVDIPTAGCWAVRVSTGGRTGLAVFNSVVTN